jgi:hypothetical protein
MRTAIKIILLLSCLVILVCSGIIGFITYDDFRFHSFSFISRAVRSYAQLAPFPASAQQFTSSSEGDDWFCGHYHISFVAPSADIDNWLQQSPGTYGVLPTARTPGVRDFWFRVEKDDVTADIRVDDTNHRVYIDVTSGGH